MSDTIIYRKTLIYKWSSIDEHRGKMFREVMVQEELLRKAAQRFACTGFVSKNVS